ncbi:MAG: MmcQ/YjbR family DNA-binding protein [Desulfobacteraceae bacterium]|nr:MmcQ/YjbR family DNA-binding protein [Desulfobacteraceae bacterium]
MTDLETLRECLFKKNGATEEYPFGPEAMVFKVMGKMFALVARAETPLRITLKCDPDLAIGLREVFKAVQPGYHMNKKHWNTVTLDGTVPDDEILRMINDSYDLVVKRLKKADREKLQ